MAFPDDLPVNARPYHIQQSIDYFAALPSPTVVTADLQTDLDNLIADIQDSSKWTDPAETLAYMCPRCSGAGQYEESHDTLDPADTDLVHCNTCDGWGYTNETITPTQVIYASRFANGAAISVIMGLVFGGLAFASGIGASYFADVMLSRVFFELYCIAALSCSAYHFYRAIRRRKRKQRVKVPELAAGALLISGR